MPEVVTQDRVFGDEYESPALATNAMPATSNPVDLSTLDEKLSDISSEDVGIDMAQETDPRSNTRKQAKNAIEKANSARKALQRGSYKIVAHEVESHLPNGRGWLNEGCFGNIPIFLPEDMFIHQMEVLMMLALFYTA
jgi:hypothetical protein